MDDKEIIGKQYGDLTVLGWFGERDSDNKKLFKCQCECGNIAYARKTHLIHGKRVSCGCRKKKCPPCRTHGMSHTRLYGIWNNMKMRCNSDRYRESKNYYCRGIRVCDEWNGSDGFASFSQWALSHGYRDDLTIDRIDNDKGYSPENCRWADIIQQSRNRRTNHILTLNGESHTVIEWSEITGIKYKTLMSRVKKGLPDEVILTASVGNRWKWDEDLVNGKKEDEQQGYSGITPSGVQPVLLQMER